MVLRRFLATADLPGNSLFELLLPVLILGVPVAEGEHGIGQRTAVAVARVHAHQHRPVLSSFHVTSV